MSSKDIRTRIRQLEQSLGPEGTIRLDNPAIDCSWLYAGGDPDFPLRWLDDPHWQTVQKDGRIAVLRHRKTGQLRAIGLAQPDDEIVRAGGDLQFL